MLTITLRHTGSSTHFIISTTAHYSSCYCSYVKKKKTPTKNFGRISNRWIVNKSRTYCNIIGLVAVAVFANSKPFFITAVASMSTSATSTLERRRGINSSSNNSNDDDGGSRILDRFDKLRNSQNGEDIFLLDGGTGEEL